MSRLKKEPLLLFLALLAVLYVLIYIIPTVTGALRTTYTAEYGRLQVYDEQKGYFVRTETVYTAAGSGSANRYISEGDLVRMGTRILKLVPDSSNNSDEPSREFRNVLDRLGNHTVRTEAYTAGKEGVVTYSVDGYEAELTPETMLKKTESYYSRLERENVLDLPKTDISQGDPVFKICDRMAWYIVCFVPSDHQKRYRKGNDISVRIDGRKTIRGEVYAVKKAGSGKTMLIVETRDYYKGFAKTRVQDVRTITSDARGLLIPNSSISKKNGQQGVYVRQKNGNYKFTPILVISTDGERSVIQSTSYTDSDGKLVDTVNNYDEILKRGR